MEVSVLKLKMENVFQVSSDFSKDWFQDVYPYFKLSEVYKEFSIPY